MRNADLEYILYIELSENGLLKSICLDQLKDDKSLYISNGVNVTF